MNNYEDNNLQFRAEKGLSYAYPQTLEDMMNELKSADVKYRFLHLEKMKENFVDFFYRVRGLEPEFIVMLDKGARAMGVPFMHYINHLYSKGWLKHKPKIVFWNNDSFNHIKLGTTPREAVMKIIEQYTLPDQTESNAPKSSLAKKFSDLVAKKSSPNIFFVDETATSGNFALTLKELFNSGIDGRYFAFSCNEPGRNKFLDAKLSGPGIDTRFNFYPTVVDDTLFTGKVGPFVVSDVHKDGIIQSTKRFKPTDQPAGDIDNFKKAGVARISHRQIQRDIEETLMSLPL